MQEVVSLVDWADAVSGFRSGMVVAIQVLSNWFNPWGMSLPRGGGVPLFYF